MNNVTGASEPTNSRSATGEFVTSYAKGLIFWPLGVVGMAADSVSETLNDKGHRRLSRPFDVTSEWCADQCEKIEPFEHNVHPKPLAKRLGQISSLATYFGAAAVGAGVAFATASNWIAAPRNGDRVVDVSKCEQPPRLWDNKEGQKTLVVPKGCKLGE